MSSKKVVFDKMTYEYLSKLYYKMPLKYEQIYSERFKSPTAKHFNFLIKQFNHRKDFPAFMCYTEELVMLIERVYKNYHKFLQIIESVPAIVLKQFTLASVISESKSTNDIEGIHSTRRELREALQSISDAPRFASIVRRYTALLSHETFKFKTCDDIRNFYDNFAHKEVIADNPKNKLDGKIFRKDSVDIDSGTGKTLHQGVYPEERIIAAMETALQVLNNEEIPFLVRVSVFHYFFGYIHPFYDGNGRTARFIASYFLAEHLHNLPALRLSLTIKRQRKKYYELFKETDSEINRADLTPFVYGFIEIINDTFSDIEFVLNRKMAQLLRYEEKLKFIMPDDELTQKIYKLLLQAEAFAPIIIKFFLTLIFEPSKILSFSVRK